jgi:hypothetical protein
MKAAVDRGMPHIPKGPLPARVRVIGNTDARAKARGLAVTSHDAGVETTAIIDDVRIEG